MKSCGKITPAASRLKQGAGEMGSFHLEGGESMSEDRDNLSGNEKEERGPISKVKSLVPLFDLILRVLELVLKVLRIIN